MRIGCSSLSAWVGAGLKKFCPACELISEKEGYVGDYTHTFFNFFSVSVVLAFVTNNKASLTSATDSSYFDASISGKFIGSQSRIFRRFFKHVGFDVVEFGEVVRGRVISNI